MNAENDRPRAFRPAARRMFGAIRHAIPHLAVIPGLIGAFMLGPVGLLLYVLLRFGLRKKLLLQE